MIINDKIIEKTRTVNCSVDIVWWKWTTREGLLSFFGRDNKVNFTIGGEFEIYFLLDNPEGERGGEGNKVLSYLPKKMLSFSWNAPPQYAEIRYHSHKTWVIVEFTAIEKSKTQVKINHIGWLTGENWDAVYNYFDEAWVTVLDRLENSCHS